MKTIPQNLRNALALLLLMAASPALHADTYTNPDSGLVLQYTISNGEATVTGGTVPSDGKLVIPETLGGVTVVTIGESAFNSNPHVKEVSAKSVTRVEKYAFSLSQTVTTIHLP